jgi:hypothetical protein
MLSRGMEESRCSTITSSIGEEQTIEQHYIHLYLSLAASTCLKNSVPWFSIYTRKIGAPKNMNYQSS